VNVKRFLSKGKNMPIIEVVEFSEWITKKYIEWRGDKFGSGTSVAKFAELFGAPQQVVSDWMKPNGKVPRSQKYINALVETYGDEVYEILGLHPPSRHDLAMRFRHAVLETVERLNKERIIPDSPEGLAIIEQVASKYGMNVKIEE
jgi:hypothetical protein